MNVLEEGWGGVGWRGEKVMKIIIEEGSWTALCIKRSEGGVAEARRAAKGLRDIPGVRCGETQTAM